MYKVISASLFLALTLNAIAEDDKAPIQLEEIIVSATRMSQTIIEVPASVTRLSQDQIEILPAANVGEILSAFPGISIIDHHGTGADPAVIVRGFYGATQNEYLLVMVDGVPVNRASDSRVNWATLPKENIQSIELVRGPGSVLYGDNALGGTLLINTVNQTVDGLSARADLAGGSFGSLDYNLQIDRKNGEFKTGLLISGQKSAGFRKAGDSSANTAEFDFEQTFKKGGSFNTRISYSKNDHDLAGPLSTSNLSLDREAVEPWFTGDKREESTARVDLRINSLPLSSFPAVFSMGTGLVSYSNDETNSLLLDHGVPPTGFVDRHYMEGREHSVYAKADLRIGLGTSGEFLTGAELSRSRYTSKMENLLIPGAELPEAANSREAWAVLAQLKFSALDNLELYLGARQDGIKEESVIHSSLSPRLGFSMDMASFGLGNTRFWGNASSAFKLPTMQQLYDNRGIVSEFGVIAFSYDQLQPQSGQNFELGLNVIHKRMSFSASMYYMDLQNEIDFDMSAFAYRNVAKSVHKGIDLSASIPLYSWLGLTAALTTGSNTIETSEEAGNSLERVPETIGRFSIDGKIHGISYQLQASHTGETFINSSNTESLEAVTLFNASLGYRLAKARFSLQVRNLLDEEYSTSGYMSFSQFLAMTGGGDPNLRLEYPGAGRSLRLGVSYEF
jgi:outer membrane cobalamin receptor